MMADEIVSSSPIMVYKTNDMCPVTGVQQFTAFHVGDIATIDQRFGTLATELDSVTPHEMVCVSLHSDPSRHMHLDVSFHEIMLRWMSWVEAQEIAHRD